MVFVAPASNEKATRSLYNDIWILFVAPLLIGGYVIVNNYALYQRTLDNLKGGHFQVTEGPVTDFVPMPYEGHRLEGFTLRGHRLHLQRLRFNTRLP